VTRGDDILAVDVGTTTLKLGVYSLDLEKRFEASRTYEAHVYDEGKADIDPEKWWEALRSACGEARQHLDAVGVLSLSVTTPGLTPMAADGTALAPAVLFFDGRSHEQAAAIRAIVGEERFLEQTCNLPVSGGSSLCSILWFRDTSPDLWDATAVFGHCNTYMVKRLTGEWAIDPSTTSITGMYNTPANDLTWNLPILELARIPLAKLPPLLHSHHPVGTILPAVARELGLPSDTVVLCGGNDAVLGALGGGLTEPGGVSMALGTVDLTTVCTDRPVSSRTFNVRCHAVPGLWFTFFVLNAGGKALEWFHDVFCRDLTTSQFYEEYVPAVLRSFLGAADIDSREAELPVFVPYLAGSRYSTERLKASFTGVTLQTTRDDLLVSLVRGSAVQHGEYLAEVRRLAPVGGRVSVSGGGGRIGGMIEARRRWTGAFDYFFREQSSLLGAAILGQWFLTGQVPTPTGRGSVTG
jgi:sugar (pentulose or hexulose) kinase